MRWSNIERNKCPKCEKDLATAETCETKAGPGIKHPCGFVISNSRFSRIMVDRTYKEELTEDEMQG